MVASVSVFNRLLLSLLVVGFLLFGVNPSAGALPYGAEAYDNSCYSDDCPPTGAVPEVGATTGAPNTGLQRSSMVWAGVAGFIGFMLLSFVVIRTIHINRVKQQK